MNNLYIALFILAPAVGTILLFTRKWRVGLIVWAITSMLFVWSSITAYNDYTERARARADMEVVR